MSLPGDAAAGQAAEPVSRQPGPFTVDGPRVRFRRQDVAERLRVTVVGDTHLFRDDARGEPFQTYSRRMAGAYNQTQHVHKGETTHPQQGFEEVLRQAPDDDSDLFVMVGDIVSFPSEAAVEWVQQRVEAAGIPFIYVAGNHDWHYEGMPGSSADLRATWTGQRLAPLYQGNDPLMAAYDVKGVRFVAIDDSIYGILPEQLAFFREQVAGGLPLVLLMHIPLYAPGRGISFGCGHPQWGADTDRNWQIERRPRWPATGHSATTFAFHREVFGAANMLGVFAGHIHHQSLDCVNGVPQFVAHANACGGYLTAEFLPL